mmetsp:Transcript_17290/g.60414  ORF Transcript_17290/g.60414 Transcript_17290/m.60414 type:complete len:487 (+) Transcript_17290:36-1496(+)
MLGSMWFLVAPWLVATWAGYRFWARKAHIHQEAEVDQALVDSAVLALRRFGPRTDATTVGEVLHRTLGRSMSHPRTVKCVLLELGKINKAMLSMLVLQGLRKQHVEPFAYHVCAAVVACGKCDAWEEALRILGAMANQSVEMNSITYGAAVNACAKRAQWRQSFALLAEMTERRIERNTIVFSAAISSCEKGHQWTRALQLLGEMSDNCVEMNKVTYSAAISACEKVGNQNKALQLLQEMADSDLEVGTIAYSSAISACEKAGQWTMALQLLSTMARTRTQMDAIVVQSAITACSRGSQWQAGLQLMRDMSNCLVEKTSDVYATAIATCGESSEWRAALQFFSDASGAPCGNYATAINACGTAAWEHTLSLMEEMVYSPLEVNAWVYLAALSACVEGGQAGGAIQALEGLSRSSQQELDVLRRALEGRLGYWQRLDQNRVDQKDMREAPRESTTSHAQSVGWASVRRWARQALSFIRDAFARQRQS